ncbi:sulfonate ABC transporter substrate-binding protein [Vulcanococcus limneticus]|uniref:sulfonate ABC transporter substrate-binding protein n=1 Tax=Vulcanococcus limneticus TaxID=2170428 RepID=UPI00398C15D4
MTISLPESFGKRFGRRSFLVSVGLATAGAILESRSTAVAAERVRIGYQKFNTLNILKSRGALEKALAPLGISVEWNEFAAGPQLLEALNVGSIDFGHAADTPPIIAQAAGTPFVYVAKEPPYPRGLAVVVRKDSPIRSIKDLKGKKVAIGKGWNVFNLLLVALEKNGLSLKDIEPVFVSTAADARSAFQQGSVDAFGTWDPFYAVVERSLDVRTLVDGKGLVGNPTFYLASRDFATKRKKVISRILDEVQKLDVWANANPEEVAKFLAPQLKVDAVDLERATRRRKYGVQPITKNDVISQQDIANRFYDLKLIPKKISIKDAVVNTDFLGNP